MHRITAILVLYRDSLVAGRRRVAYMTLTLIVTTAAWLVLAAMSGPFVPQAGSRQGGLTITNSGQRGAPLPLRYARRIIATPGARDVTWIAMQVVNCGGSSLVPVGLSAIAGPGTDASLSLHHVGAATIARWNKDPEGILVARQTLAKCGWRIGEGISPPTMSGSGKNIEVHVIGAFESRRGGFAFAHYDYINRVAPMMGKDTVFAYSAKAANPRDDDALAARIEAEFAHDFPSVSATTDANAQGVFARFGKVQQLLAFVMGAILLCAASVLVTVLAHHAAQERRHFALLQVLGFRRATLFAAFALEVLSVLVLGAVLGGIVGHELARLPLFGHALVMSTGFSIPGWAWAWIPAWLAALLVVSLAWPASAIARVKPADYRAI